VATTHSLVFDLKPDSDVYWCAADIGWVTGHSYIVYGPLANRTTGVMYEGAPNYPDFDRFWQIIADYGVTIFYTAPTAIRAFMKWGDEYPARTTCPASALGTVGEPINPEAWIWYHAAHRQAALPDRRHLVADRDRGDHDHPAAGVVTATKPGSATKPFPGISPTSSTTRATSRYPGWGGYLVITEPWPAMARTIWGDDERFVDTYWSASPACTSR
jgi:acetyl-CoA synthetase